MVKIFYSGGSLFEEGYGALEGSLSVPVRQARYGVALDAAAGRS